MSGLRAREFKYIGQTFFMIMISRSVLFVKALVLSLLLVSCGGDKKESTSGQQDSVGTGAKVPAAKKKTIVFLATVSRQVMALTIRTRHFPV
jgi:uncharacterized lipoprotein YehR (DUF1307 family)